MDTDLFRTMRWFFFPCRYNPHWGLYFTAFYWALASSLTRFLDHTQWRATFGRTSLNEWSVRRREFYLTTHNTHNRQISKPRVGFEPTISAGERPKTYALDRAATGTGHALITNSHVQYIFQLDRHLSSLMANYLVNIQYTEFHFKKK